jgi:hypothetical protein
LVNVVPADVNFIYHVVPNLDVADVVEGTIYYMIYIVTAIVVDVDIVPQYLLVFIILMFTMFVIFKLKLFLLLRYLCFL